LTIAHFVKLEEAAYYPSTQLSFLLTDFPEVLTNHEILIKIDNLIDGVKTLPKAEGFNEIFVPGEPENKTYDERIKHGIPLPDGTVRNLRNAAEKFGIRLPIGLSD